MKRLRQCGIAIMFLSLSSSVCLSVNLCDDDQLQNFMSTCGRLSREFTTKDNKQRWVEFGELLRETRECQDGVYAEGLAGISEDALTSDWDGFIQYASSSKADPQTIETIVGLAVNETTSEDNLAKIKKNAESKCPSKLATTCNSIKAFNPLPSH